MDDDDDGSDDGTLDDTGAYQDNQDPFTTADNGTVNSDGSTSDPSWQQSQQQQANQGGNGTTQAPNATNATPTTNTSTPGMSPSTAPAPSTTSSLSSYLPWILGGLAVLVGLFLFTRKA